METITVSPVRIEKDEQERDVVVADFSPPASPEWLTRLAGRLGDRNFTFSYLTTTGVKVPFHGQSQPAEAAISHAVAETNGSPLK